MTQDVALFSAGFERPRLPLTGRTPLDSQGCSLGPIPGRLAPVLWAIATIQNAVGPGFDSAVETGR
jgi:hypothetical protein